MCRLYLNRGEIWWNVERYLASARSAGFRQRDVCTQSIVHFSTLPKPFRIEWLGMGVRQYDLPEVRRWLLSAREAFRTRGEMQGAPKKESRYVFRIFVL